MRDGKTIIVLRCAVIGVSALLCVAADAAAQTFAWTGGGGDALFSTPQNWADGVVPISGDGVSLEFGRGGYPTPRNDLAGLTVGTFTTAGLGLDPAGSDLTVTSTLNAPDFQYGTDLSSLRLVGDTRLLTGGGLFTGDGGDGVFGGGFYPFGVSAIIGLHGSGSLTAPDAALLFNLGYEGVVNVPAGSYLGVYSFQFQNTPPAGPSQVRLGRVEGVVDFQGEVRLLGGSADLSGATLNLLGIPQAPEVDAATHARLEGDVKLGAWFVGGSSIGYPDFTTDRLDVTGTLDLTEASFTANSYLFTGGHTITADDVPDYLTIATYGNRVGELDQHSLRTIIQNFGDQPYPIFFIGDAPIVYTSGENAGPGEIRVMIPEPTAGGLALAAGVSLLRRRRRPKTPENAPPERTYDAGNELTRH